MNFIFNLTWREIRSSWRRLLFFFLCIAIGVGSVVALRSLIQNLSKSVGGDARALLTADLEVSSTNDFSPTDIQKIEAVVNNTNIIEARNEAITSSAMPSVSLLRPAYDITDVQLGPVAGHPDATLLRPFQDLNNVQLGVTAAQPTVRLNPSP